MKASIHFIDIGAQTIELKMELDVAEDQRKADLPTPAAVLALATKAMFENGMLARAGQVALEGASKGIDPADSILAHYEEKNNDNTDT